MNPKQEPIMELYPLKDYKVQKQHFEAIKKEYAFDECCKLLLTNKGYHLRIKKGNNYTFFGDLDNIPFDIDVFMVDMINFMKEDYDLEIVIGDFSYTANDSKKGSHHYSIPKYYASVEKLKEIHDNFNKRYGTKYICDKGKCVDTSIYSDKWWRLPNQLKQSVPNTEHIIKKGIMADFIVEYIQGTAKDISNVNFITPKTVKKIVSKKVVHEQISLNDSDDVDFLETHESIKKILGGLSPKRCIEYEWWEKVGYCLKNDGYPLELFDYFSKLHYDKYDKEEVEMKYASLIVRNNEMKKLSVKTLKYWLWEDNKSLYQKVQQTDLDSLYAVEIADDEEFCRQKLGMLYKLDKSELGDKYYDIFEHSRSFKYFNRFHVHVMKSSCIYLLDPNKSPEPYKDKSFLPGLKINHKDRIYNFLNLWMEKETSRHIKGFIFNPNKNFPENKNYLNLFTGFIYDINNDGKYDIHAIEPYINHIKHVCNYNEDVYNYVMNWIAHIFQKPHVKIGVALVLYSETHGVGKNLICDVLEKLLSRYYLKLTNIAESVSNFNSHHQNKLLNVCDEISARTRELSDELKDIITRKTIKVTYKGQESYVIDDYTNYIFTTNNQVVVKVETTDRRLMIIDCIEKKLDHKMTKSIVDILDNNDSLKQIYNYFKSLDISEFYPGNLVVTEFKKELILNDMPAYIKMLKYEALQYDGTTHTAKQIFDSSIKYANANKLPHGYTEQGCAKNLMKFFVQYRTRVNNKSTYIFPDNFSELVDEIILKQLKIDLGEITKKNPENSVTPKLTLKLC